MSLSRILVPAVISGALALGGCTIHTDPAPAYATTEVTSAPTANIETYPSEQYEGRPVYLYNDHWYYRNGNRWSYYNQEPEQLRQRRYVQKAPPAPRGYAPPAVQAAPPAPGPGPRGPGEAPPAVRVQ